MKTIDLKIDSSRLRANLEGSKVDALVTSSRLRASILFENYKNLNYTVILEDYFAEDYVIDYIN